MADERAGENDARHTVPQGASSKADGKVAELDSGVALTGNSKGSCCQLLRLFSLANASPKSINAFD